MSIPADSGDSSELLLTLARLFKELEPSFAESATLEDVWMKITRNGVEAVDGAEAAAVSWGRPNALKTVASTGDLPLHVDAIQYEIGTGPCVDAAVQQKMFLVNDVAADPRWPDFGPRAAAETGVQSMLSYRMYLEGERGIIAGLNFYTTKKGAFSEQSQTAGLLLSAHAALALASREQAESISQLKFALMSNRDIGVAVGILMSRHKVTKEQGFDLLRIVSQRTHRKLVDLANEVIDTGILELPVKSATA